MSDESTTRVAHISMCRRCGARIEVKQAPPESAFWLRAVAPDGDVWTLSGTYASHDAARAAALRMMAGHECRRNDGVHRAVRS